MGQYNVHNQAAAALETSVFRRGYSSVHNPVNSCLSSQQQLVLSANALCRDSQRTLSSLDAIIS